MRYLWNRLGPFGQGMVLGYGIVFMSAPTLWLLTQWWRLFFPAVPK